MKALCWNGAGELRVERVPDPAILAPQDVVIKVSLSSASGADLPLIDGHAPGLGPGDILGHEFLGEVVEKGPEVLRLNRGDRVVTIPVLACGKCWHCRQEDYALCDNSNPDPGCEERAYGHAAAGILGCGRASGGYAGGHAEYVRVPFADHNCFRVPEGVGDAQAVFVSDTVPTGFMAADMAGIRPGDVVAVWGCGGLGQMAARSARLLGAERVVAIDRHPGRLRAAQEKAGAEPLDGTRVDVCDALLAMSGGRGPDVCIDAAGPAAGSGAEGWFDRKRQALGLDAGRPAVLHQMIRSCRKGGTLSIAGLRGGTVDGFPIGAAMAKGLTLRMGRQRGQRYVGRLFERIGGGELDPSYLMTHQWPLDDAPRGYRMFKEQRDRCLRVVFAP